MGLRGPNPPFATGRRALIALWTVLLGLKLAYALALTHAPASDEILYIHLARSVAAGQGYLDAYGRPTGAVMPGFPLLAALALRLGGGHLAALLVLQVLATLVIALACGRLAELFTGRRRLGQATALIVFCLPPYFYYAHLYQTEIPFAAWMMLSLVCWEKLRREPGRLRLWALTGLFHTLAWMTRPVSFPLTPVILGWPLAAAWIQAGRQRMRALAGAALASAVLLALWAPWVAHNYRIYHRFVPLTYVASAMFYAGTLTDWTQWSEQIDKTINESGIADHPIDLRDLNGPLSGQLSEYLAKKAKENIRRDPLGYVYRSVSNSWRFWLAEYPSYFYKERLRDYLVSWRLFSLAGKGALLALNVALIGGMLWACWVLRRQWTYWPYMLLLFYYHTIHAVIMPIARYSAPLHGLVVVLIVAAAAERARRGGGGPARETA